MAASLTLSAFRMLCLEDRRSPRGTRSRHGRMRLLIVVPPTRRVKQFSRSWVCMRTRLFSEGGHHGRPCAGTDSTLHTRLRSQGQGPPTPKDDIFWDCAGNAAYPVDPMAIEVQIAEAAKGFGSAGNLCFPQALQSGSERREHTHDGIGVADCD